MGTIKNFITKTATTAGISLGVYGGFWLGDLVANRLDIPAKDLENLVGSFGENGLDGAIRYALPLATVYGFRRLAEYAEKKFE